MTVKQPIITIPLHVIRLNNVQEKHCPYMTLNDLKLEVFVNKLLILIF